ncbi:MAG: FAD:protein FMN transferase [Bacteroidales bacterium]|nr:FAD:protein FMN transferase [Bacteroidales bacterium]
MKTQSTYYASNSMFQGSATDVMGTKLEVLIVGLAEKKAYSVWGDITSTVKELDRTFNRFDPQSEVSRLNASEVDIETSDTFKDALNLCETYFILTKNLFDISRGGREDLDFGGFAKGYALRRIAVILKAAHVKDAFVNFGNSSILGIGTHPYGDCWKVGLTNPYTDDVIKEFELKNCSLSTSGNTPGYCGHIINPLTHKADESRVLSTVVAKDPLDAEVLSTVFLIASEAQRKDILLNFPGVVYESFDI